MILALLATAAVAPPAAGAYSVNEFTTGLSASADPYSIVAAPDGNLWFTEAGTNRIGRITTAGTITEYWQGIVAGDGPNAQDGAITVGSDNNVWFTGQHGYIGSVTASGAINEVHVGGNDLRGIAGGSDGALWVADHAGTVYRTTTSDPGGASPYSTSSHPDAITAGPGGNLWFTSDTVGGGLWNMTTLGVPSWLIHYPNAGGAGGAGLVTGPDGNVWVTEQQTATDAIARVQPNGMADDFTLPNASANPTAIAAGSDGALWFTESNANSIGRITISGQITEITLPNASSQPAGIASGPDGNIWFTEEGGNRIGEIPVPHTLTVTVAGTGTVTGTGISCPGTCSVNETGPVTLTATPPPPPIGLGTYWEFAGWSGGGCSGTGTCTVPLNADASVTATFTSHGLYGVVALPVGERNVAGTAASFSYRCDGSAGMSCQGHATLTAVEHLGARGKITSVTAARARRKTVTVGTKAFTVAAGQEPKITVALNSTGKKLLARFKRIATTLTIAVNGGVTYHYTVTFKQKR